MMRRRAKRIREGQARERKKEGKPAYFGAHVIRTRFRKTRLVRVRVRGYTAISASEGS